MTVYQCLSQVPVLGHVNQGTVNRTVAVRMVFSHCITDNTRTLTIRFVRCVIHFIHGVENTSLHRFETITYIRQGSCHNDGHGVFKEVSSDFLGEVCFCYISRIEVFFIKLHEII